MNQVGLLSIFIREEGVGGWETEAFSSVVVVVVVVEVWDFLT